MPTDADIYNARLWKWDAVMRPESRDAYRRRLAQGWTDSTRHLHPNEVIYTYWDYGIAFRRNEGFRMDFSLLNPALASKLKDANVDSEFRGRDRASDHAPTWITLTGPLSKPCPTARSKATLLRAPAGHEPDSAE